MPGSDSAALPAPNHASHVCSCVGELGRATQGVTLISLDVGEKLSGLEKVAESEGDTDAEAGDELADGEMLEGGEDSAASEEA